MMVRHDRKPLRKCRTSAPAILLCVSMAPAIGTCADSYSIDLLPRNFVQLDTRGAQPIHQEGAERVEANLDGSESSQCAAYGRQSFASGTADVLLLERKSDSLAFSLTTNSASFGGHYRTCTTCLSGRCIGVSGNDTRANATAASKAVLRVKFDDNARTSEHFIDVAIASSGERPTVVVTDNQGREISALAGGSYPIHPTPGAIFYLTATSESRTSNIGYCCNEKKESTARVDIRIRKAPLLTSYSSFEPMIRGGAQTSSYQNVGAILIDGQLHCTGTVAGPSTILTAAHCLHGYENQLSKFTFLVGTNVVQPSYGPVKVSSFSYPKEPEGYNFNPDTLEDDIGILYLESPTDINPVRLHAGMPDWAAIKNDQTSLVFVGYGYDVVDDQKVGSGIKREAAWAIDAVENRRVRFSVPNRNTCKGDSGGPAFLIANGMITQVAVTSGGSADCSSGFETRIDAYSPWLLSRIR